MSDKRQFWMAMYYGCDKCSLVAKFFLESGCEGPRDGTPMKFRYPPDHPLDPNGEHNWPRTESGRLVVPVPFAGMGCPVCQPKRPWSMAKGAGVLSHVRWEQDREFGFVLTETELPSVWEAGRFYYPPGPIEPAKSAMDQQPCGMPRFRRHDSRVKSE